MCSSYHNVSLQRFTIYVVLHHIVLTLPNFLLFISRPTKEETRPQGGISSINYNIVEPLSDGPIMRKWKYPSWFSHISRFSKVLQCPNKKLFPTNDFPYCNEGREEIVAKTQFSHISARLPARCDSLKIAFFHLWSSQGYKGSTHNSQFH